MPGRPLALGIGLVDLVPLVEHRRVDQSHPAEDDDQCKRHTDDDTTFGG